MIFNVRVFAAMQVIIMMVCGSLMIAVGVASAATPDLVSDDRFTSAGVRVFDEESVGTGCTLFGFCSRATFAQLSRGAVTRATSEEQGEPVVADCTLNDLVRVRLISRIDSEDVLIGWASVRSVNIRGSIGPC